MAAHDTERDKPPTLPGNHGQFGVDKASEAYRTLKDQPAATDAAPAPVPAPPSTGEAG